MTRALALALLFGWFVTTYSGQAVAGPFTDYTDCQDMAKLMAKKYTNVSTTCVWR